MDVDGKHSCKSDPKRVGGSCTSWTCDSVVTQNQSWPSCSDSSGSWRAIVRPTAWRPGSSSADNSKSRETRRRQWECFYSLLRSAPLKAGEGDAAEGAGGAASKPGRVQEFVPSPEGQRGDGGSSNAAGPEGPAGRGAGPRETVSPRTERRGRFTRTFTGRTSAPIFIYICIYVCVCVWDQITDLEQRLARMKKLEVSGQDTRRSEVQRTKKAIQTLEYKLDQVSPEPQTRQWFHSEQFNWPGC